MFIPIRGGSSVATYYPSKHEPPVPSKPLPPAKAHKMTLSPSEMERMRMKVDLSEFNRPQTGPIMSHREWLLSTMDPFDREFYEKNPDQQLSNAKFIRFERRYNKVTGEPDTFDESLYDKPIYLDDGSILIYLRPESRTIFEHGVGDKFFQNSQTFFEDMAKLYLKDPKLITSSYSYMNSIGSYAGNTQDFFDKEDSVTGISLYTQIKYAIKELAEQMKAGKGSSLETLTTKLSVGDIEFSVSQLTKTVKAMHDIDQPLEHISGGSLDVTDFLALGLAVSQVDRFASENLTKEQGDLLSKIYRKRVESAIEYADSRTPSLGDKLADAGMSWDEYRGDPFAAIYTKSAGTAKEAVYNLFSNLDTSSNAAYQASFSRAMQTFDGYMQRLGKFYWTAGYYNEVNRAFYGLQISRNGTHRSDFFDIHA